MIQLQKVISEENKKLAALRKEILDNQRHFKIGKTNELSPEKYQNEKKRHH